MAGRGLFVLLALLTFRCAWGVDVTIASSMSILGLAFQTDGVGSLQRFFSGRPLFGYANYSISLFNYGCSSYRSRLSGGSMRGISGRSLAMVWFLRLWSLSWRSRRCLVGFWVNSILLASAGLSIKWRYSLFRWCRWSSLKKAGGVRSWADWLWLGGGLGRADDARTAGRRFAGWTLFGSIRFLRLIQIKWLGVACSF